MSTAMKIALAAVLTATACTCSEETEANAEQLGSAVEGTAESAGEDIERGAQHISREIADEVEELDQAIERDRRPRDIDVDEAPPQPYVER